MLPQRQINFLLPLLVSLKRSWQLLASLIVFSKFIGPKSVNALTQHSECITDVPLSFAKAGIYVCFSLACKPFRATSWEEDFLKY